MSNLTTHAQTSNFDNATAVITRKGAMVNGGYTASTVYSGTCDFQSERGTPFYNPSGVVDVSDAMLYLDSLVNVDPGDAVAVTQNGVTSQYTAVNSSVYQFPMARTEVALKAGPLEYKVRGR